MGGKKQLSIHVENKLKKIITELAKDEQRSINKQVVYMIEHYMKNLKVS